MAVLHKEGIRRMIIQLTKLYFALQPQNDLLHSMDRRTILILVVLGMTYVN